MASTSLDSFLSGNQFSTSPEWDAIIQQSPFQLRKLPSDQTRALTIKSVQLWNLTFSSSRNTAKFGPPAQGASDASTPDEPPDAVFGLLMTAEALNTLMLQNDVRRAFGLGPSNTPPKIAAFFSRIDPNQTLTLTLDTSDGARSAFWALSGPVYRTAVSLVFVLPDTVLDAIKAFVLDERGINLHPTDQAPFLTIRMLTSHTISGSPIMVQSESSIAVIVTVQTEFFDIELHLDASGLEIRFSDSQSASASSTPLTTRLSQTTAGSSTTIPAQEALPDSSGGGLFNNFLEDIEVFYMVPRVSQEAPVDDEAGNTVSVPGINYWQIILIANWQTEAGVVLALQYDSRISTLYGRLLFDSDASGSGENRRFDYDPKLDVELATSKPLPASLDIWKLFSPSTKAPAQIPSQLTSASVQFGKGATGDSVVFGISGTISAAPAVAVPDKAADSAPDGFVWDRVKIQALIQNNAGSVTASISLSSEMSFKIDNVTPPVKLYFGISYRSPGSWILHGQANDIPLSALSNFFAPSVRKSAMKMLGSIAIRTLDMIYTYDPSGEATSFFISAALVLGELELDLSYEYASTRLLQGVTSASQIAKTEGINSLDRDELRPQAAEASWTFEATLGAASPKTDIGKVIDSLMGESTILPSFVRNIPVGAAASGDAAVKLAFHGVSASTVLAISIKLGAISLTFVSFTSANDAPKKTVLRVSIDELEVAKSVPLIKELPQPFDTLLYLWLSDEETDATKAGLFAQDLQIINDTLAGLNILPILTKDTNKQNTGLAALRVGHHFMIVNHSTVILDHNFSDSDATSTPSGTTTPSNPSAPAADAGSAPTKGAMNKKLPFLSIDVLSLLYKKGALGISIDATVRLGPITFSLIGFSMAIVLSSLQLNNLKGVQPVVDIHGLEVMLDSPPVTLAGVFIHDTSVTATGETLDSYRGGVSLGFEEWKFLAVGEYGIVKDANGNSFKAFFVYAKLDGPLITLAFATVSGVRIGLGYNSMVRSPPLLELANFPFLNDRVDGDAGQDPLKIVKAMTQGAGGGPAWVSPKEDSYWVAAGLTLTAFGVMAVTAVLMFGVRDSGFVISVFANGVVQIPSEVKPDATLFYIEINMLAELNTADGYFTVQAALAPSSHVLVPSCRLTGGFALVNWFAPNANAGDFVFTVGGYHRAYTPPAWYPVPPRLGVAFTLGKMINVTGNVYFAVTPKCVMGGGALHMGLEIGPVSAWLDAAMDVFVQFKPFHYTADIAVSVGCAISIKVWFVHVRISASVGAALHIEGPEPFGGSAHVDFYLFGFTIDFGERAKPPPPVSLPVFYQMVNTPGPAKSVESSQAESTDPLMARLKLNSTGGLLPQNPTPSTSSPSSGPFPDTGASKPWIVKAGTFSFSIESDFAISAAEIIQGEGANQSQSPLQMPNGSPNVPALYSKPMHIDQPISSTMQISIYRLGSNDTRTRIAGFEGQLILKKVPTALWAPYSEVEDPSRTKNPGALTNPSQPVMELCMGASLHPPPPLLIDSNIQSFDSSIAFREMIGPYTLPPPSEPQSTFLASAVPYPSESPVERWAHLAQDWKTASANGERLLEGEDEEQGEGILGMAARWLGWDTPPPGQGQGQEGGGGRKAWELSGKMPRALVGSLGEEYTVLPRLGMLSVV